MSDVAFNGTTVKLGTGTIGALIAAIKSVQYQGTCARVPLTGSDATTRTFAPGLPQESLTIEVVGASTLVKGTTPPVAVTWSDGGITGSFAKGAIMKTPSMAGTTDGPNSSTITIQPSK